MSGFLPIALQGTAVEPYKLPMQWEQLRQAAAEVPLTQARTGLTEAQVPLTEAQTVGEQIKNRLGELNLGIRTWGFGQAAGGAGGNAGEALPDEGQPTASGYGPAGDGTAPPVLSRDRSQTIGMQAYNPSNLTYAGQPGVVGVIPAAGGIQIAAFPDMPSGIAATARQLMINQDQHGAHSVRDMVTQWVHDPKADLTTYIADTARALGVSPDAPVNWHDPNVQTAFILAQHPHESAGGATTLNPEDVRKGVALAATGQPGGAGQPGAPAPYRVAQAGGGWQPPPTGQAGTLAAAGGGAAAGQGGGQAGALNPMGTSRAGTIWGGMALPQAKVGLAWLSNDPAKALNDLIAERKATIATVAGEATDAQSWNQGVEQLWRQGYLTNGEYRHFHGQFSPELRDQVVRAQGSAESQSGFQSGLIGRGLKEGVGGQIVPEPTYQAGQPPVTVKQPLPGGGQREVTYSAPEYMRQTAGAGAGAPGAPPPAAVPPPGGQGLGSDGNWYTVPEGNAPGAAQPAAGGGQGSQGGGPGSATPPAAPAAGGPPGAVPGTTPAANPPTPPLPAGALGAGKVELGPEQQKQLDLETKQREIAMETQAQIQRANQVAVAQQYGTEAAKNVANGQSAPITLERLDALENAANLFRSGAAGPQRATLMRGLQEAMQSLGFKTPDWLNDQTTGADVVNKLGSFLAANMVTAMGEKAASVFESVKNIQPNLMQSTGGYQAVLNSVRMDALRQRDLLNFQEHWLAPTAQGGLGHDSIQGMQQAFNKANPIEVYSSRVLPYPMPASQAQAIPRVIYRLPNNSIALWDGQHFLPAQSQAAKALAP